MIKCNTGRIYYFVQAIILILLPAKVMSFTVSGQVIRSDNNSPVSNCTIVIAQSTAVSAADGRFTVDEVPGGSHTVNASGANIVVDDFSLNVPGNIVDLIITADRGKVLAVAPLAALKDTGLLCINGCDTTVSPWDSLHTTYSTHERAYCVPTAITMINRYWGGELKIDEASHWLHKRPNPDESTLGHGLGATCLDATFAMRWVFENPATIVPSETEPTDNDYKGWIDQGRPFYWSCGWVGQENLGHAMAVSGYRLRSNNVFELLFLNTDNRGSTVWGHKENNVYTISGQQGTFWQVICPPLGSRGINRNNLIQAHSDNDGVCDFDEIERWVSPGSDLNPNEADTDHDGIPDKLEISGVLFKGGNVAVGLSKFDQYGDGIRAEVDNDSDNGGVMDGIEDQDGIKDEGGTDPYENPFPNRPNTNPKIVDDIPAAKIDYGVMTSPQTGRTLMGPGLHSVKLKCFRAGGTVPLPVISASIGPLKAFVTLPEAQPVEVTLMPIGPLPSCEWGMIINITREARPGQGTVMIKNADTQVPILEGETFYVDVVAGVVRN